MNTNNLILTADSYKYSHKWQFPKGMTSSFCYLEAREGATYKETTFFGAQYVMKRHLSTPITEADILHAKELLGRHGVPFDEDGWRMILNDHRGFLPISIRAVPEGTTVPEGNVLLTVESTDPRLPWVPGFVETLISRTWYGSTVCTQSRVARIIIERFLRETSDIPDIILPSRLHDFGARGVSSAESAGIGGCAHLVNFQGTDTVEALEVAANYYGCPMAGFSIPAMEHSTVTSWGRDHEVDAYRNMLQQFGKPGAFLAAVSDSYDLENAVSNIWGTELRQEVLDSGATVVIRPDSGDPATVVVDTLCRLATAFGTTKNSKGFLVLNNVAVIQGDGIDVPAIEHILTEVTKQGFSAQNVAFGSGGALLQKVNRDTQRFAYKISEIVVNGEARPVCKAPKTDMTKRSKAGRLDLVFRDGRYQTVVGDAGDSVLRTVWENGELLIDDTLDEIRQRAKV